MGVLWMCHRIAHYTIIICSVNTYNIVCCTVAGGGGAASSEVEGSFSSECSLSLASVLTLLDAACPSGVDGVE